MQCVISTYFYIMRSDVKTSLLFLLCKHHHTNNYTWLIILTTCIRIPMWFTKIQGVVLSWKGRVWAYRFAEKIKSDTIALPSIFSINSRWCCSSHPKSGFFFVPQLLMRIKRYLWIHECTVPGNLYSKKGSHEREPCVISC